MPRKDGGRELASIEDSVNASIKRLEDYIRKSGGRLISATRNSTDNTWTNKPKINRKQKWEEKQLYGRFKRRISNISRENMYVGMKRKP